MRMEKRTKMPQGLFFKPRNILCPRCMMNVTVKETRDEKWGTSFYYCEGCKQLIPTEYIESRSVPKYVIGAVGFPRHGKTVYFASLFRTLYNKDDGFWPKFFPKCIDEDSFETVKKNYELLNQGVLPDPTQNNFPKPTIVSFNNMPDSNERLMIFCDASGESLKDAQSIQTNAYFINRIKTVIFMLDLNKIKYQQMPMHELLTTYMNGLSSVGGKTKNQHLVVVISKGDELNDKLASSGTVWNYLQSGLAKELGKTKQDMKCYIDRMKKISIELENFLRADSNATTFIELAKASFKSVEVSIVSSLGSKPDGKTINNISPKRILDPLLWVIHKS